MKINPSEADMVKRTAVAVRNLIAQDHVCNTWADWVPQHLDGLAERILTGEPVSYPETSDAQ